MDAIAADKAALRALRPRIAVEIGYVGVWLGISSRGSCKYDKYRAITRTNTRHPHLSPHHTKSHHIRYRSGSGCATAVLSRTITTALGPRHRTHFLATDLNPKAARATLGTGGANGVGLLEVVQGDLLTSLQPRVEGLVDVLVFNPPYVPTPPEEVGGRCVPFVHFVCVVCVV